MCGSRKFLQGGGSDGYLSWGGMRRIFGNFIPPFSRSAYVLNKKIILLSWVHMKLNSIVTRNAVYITTCITTCIYYVLLEVT